MTYPSAATIPWLGFMLCYCHMLCTVGAAQYSSSSSSMLKSSLGDSHLIPNSSTTSKAALLSIFAKYGQNGSLSFEGFERLLDSLHLGNTADSDGNSSEHHHSIGGSWSVTLAADDHHHGHDDEPHGSEDELHVDHNDEVQQNLSSSTVCANCLSSVVNCLSFYFFVANITICIV